MKDRHTAKTILLVEDEAILALSEKRLLEIAGYGVTTARSGEDAVNQVKDNPRIDLVLMDIDLGEGMDGTEAAQKILELRELPVVFLTSHTEPELVEKTEKITSYGYVVKNTGQTVLLTSIKMAFRLRSAKKEGKEKDRRFAELFEMSLDLTCIADINTGIFLQVNPAFTQILGYTQDELLGTPYTEFVHPEDVQYSMEVVENDLKAGIKVFKFENRYKTKDGSYRWISWTSHPRPKQGITFAVGRDITARKQYELELSESESRYRHIFNHSSISIIEEDIGELRKELLPLAEKEDIQAYLQENPKELDRLLSLVTVTDVNEAALLLYEIEDKETLLGSIPKIMLDTCRDPFIKELTAIAENEVSFEVALPPMDINGHTKYIYKRIHIPPPGDPDQLMLLSLADITHQKQLEITLQDTKEFLGKIIDTAPDPIFVKDEKHAFVLCNSPFCRFMGRNRTELMGKSDPDFFPPEEVEVFRKNDDEILATGEISLKEEQLTDSSGTTRDIMTRKALFIDKDNKKFIVGVIRDVTELKRAQVELRLTAEENKSLLHELQHRVKNSFSIIASLLQFELTDAEDKPVKQVLLRIKNRIDSISNLYSILQVSDTVREIHLGDYIGNIVSGLRESYLTLSDGNEIQFHPEESYSNTKTAMAIGLIVNELVTNALKYAFPNERCGKIDISLTQKKGTYNLIVRDNGIGISRNENNKKVGGLGLKLVDMLTEQHHGTLEKGCYDNSNQGTSFIITIPVR